ncbi:putative chromosome segregation protein [Zalerion maritima]|uniref:Chromosome segregation protein n=1 Tax=Zalerion maritima TaxID=339359 RepID=A0AAD5RRM4_9PEZI|nr:putative chromosome segregation protein [Zalerion maritima]
MDSAGLIQLLEATLDHRKARQAQCPTTSLKLIASKPKNIRKTAERELKVAQATSQFSIALLKVVATDSLPIHTRLAGSLCFKNFIRSNYTDDDGNYKIPLDEVALIKKELISLMIQCPPKIQTQLGEAISIIADSDFYERWETLVQDLVNQLSGDDPKVNIGVLEVAHSVFQKWRPLYQSNALYTEINHVLNVFALPYIEMLKLADQKIGGNVGNKAVLQQWFEVLSLLVKLFFDLSCQDMPPQFEEHLKDLSTLLHKYLIYENPLLVTDDESETGILEIVKADICDALELYTRKFDEEFGALLQPFISSAWNLLSTTGPETKYDILISRALNFLTAVAGSRHATIFNDENVLNQIVEKVVVPNVSLRESDIEMFEDEPIEFIRRDLEGSDNDSRRRAATDFLRRLLEKFEQMVTTVVMKYIEHFVARGKEDWKAKDTAIYLFIAVAAKGAVTSSQGVKTVNSYLNVVQFFETNVASDLIATDVEPIAKVDAVKYLYTFRSQLTKEQWSSAFTPLIQNLGSDNYVVYTYAAIAVERVLFLTNDAGQHLFTREDIQPFAKDLLDHLFKLIQKSPDPPKMQENEFLMRCIMRVIIVLQDNVLPILDDVLAHLINITNIIKANPSNPRFYYYHFEALGAIVRFGAQSVGNKLEEALWQPFHQILAEEVSEFVPYVLQILAKLLEANPTGALSDNYKTLMTPLLTPAMWETRGNVPGCARLLSALIPRGTQFIGNQELIQILGIFQRLIDGKKIQMYGFDVLDAAVLSFTAATLDPYFKDILNVLFAKLDKDPSDSFKHRFVRFYHVVSSKTDQGMGADYFIQHADTIQGSIFTPVYLTIILPTTAQLPRPVDRKTAVVSLTKTLTESTMFRERYQKKGWGFTCEALLTLLQSPPQVTAGYGDEMITEADVDDIGFGMGYTPLNTCKQATRDDFPEIQDVQNWVSVYMKAANQQSNGTLLTFAAERLSDQAKAALIPYLQ